MDLGENETNSGIDMKIKEEPIVKEEPLDSMVIAIASTSSEVGVNRYEANDTVKSEDEIDEKMFDSIFDYVKDEDDCSGKKVKKEKNPDSDGNENEHANQMAASNDDRGETNKVGKGKKRKQSKRRIPKEQKAVKEKKHKCQKCQYETSDKSNLTRHIRIHSGIKPFECDICSKKFSLKQDLDRHMITHSGERPFGCSYCHKSFSNKRILNNHLRIHRFELKFDCSKCGQRFAEEGTKDSHEDHCEIRRYECYLCRYKCFMKSGMTMHMQAKHLVKHTGDKKFQCEICGKKVSQKLLLRRHYAKHREQFPHKCPKCYGGFPEISELILHEKICRCRQYQCYICSTFKRNITILNYHMKSQHTGERPFKCKFCNARFFSENHANQHMKIHGFY